MHTVEHIRRPFLPRCPQRWPQGSKASPNKNHDKLRLLILLPNTTTKKRQKCVPKPMASAVVVAIFITVYLHYCSTEHCCLSIKQVVRRHNARARCRRPNHGWLAVQSYRTTTENSVRTPQLERPHCMGCRRVWHSYCAAVISWSLATEWTTRWKKSGAFHYGRRPCKRCAAQCRTKAFNSIITLAMVEIKRPIHIILTRMANEPIESNRHL